MICVFMYYYIISYDCCWIIKRFEVWLFRIIYKLYEVMFGYVYNEKLLVKVGNNRLII